MCLREWEQSRDLGLQSLLALTKLGFGRHDQALRLVQEALRALDETGSRDNIVFSLIALAAAHTESGVKVAAKVSQIQDQGRTHVLFSTVFHELQEAVAELRTQSDRDHFAKIWAEGAAMSLGEARKAALDLCDVR